MARESREGDGRVLTWWACPYLARPHLRLNYACAQPGTVVVRLSSFPPQFLSKLKVVNVVSASQRRPIEFPQTQIGQDTSVVPLQNNWYHSEFPLPEEKTKTIYVHSEFDKLDFKLLSMPKGGHKNDYT